MSEPAKVVPIRPRRRNRRGARPPGAPRERRREGHAERAGRRAEAGSRRGEGPLVALARLLQDGARGLNWENLAGLSRRLYFSWHSEEVDEFGYDARFSERIRPIFEFLYAVWWRVESIGVENVPGAGAALIVANHSGVLPWDGAMIKLAVRHEHPARRECRLLALDMFALLPFLAPLLARIGEVRASQENGERLLRKGELVGVFPEGVKGVGKRFKDRYKLARFGRGGFVRLALRCRAPIVPCAVVGAEEIYPTLARADWVGRPLGLPYFPLTPAFPLLGPLGVIPLPSRWSIEFAEPLAVEGYGPEAAEDPILVNRLSEEVRSRIQRMIHDRLARRRSIWFG